MTSIESLRYIPLRYDSQTENLRDASLEIILVAFPEWKSSQSEIEVTKLTHGINNTLLKIVKKRQDSIPEEGQTDAVLLRAYGSGTEILIDRDREIACHSLLAEHDLASTLIARFQNGLLYKYVPGKVCKPEDIRRESVWRGVARRMGHWHAALPLGKLSTIDSGGITPDKPNPNIWTVMEKWIQALPTRTEEESKNKQLYTNEFDYLVKKLGNTKGLGGNGFVFGHNDLLAGNIIIQSRETDGVEIVNFIDYEYATPTPAAFDIVSHFAEWAGFECDYNLLPTKAIRRDFLKHYVKSYNSHAGQRFENESEDQQVDRLFEEVDSFRAVPSFFWGICSLIQATISEFDFDHKKYSDLRLGEYWDWRAEGDGSREQEGKEMSLRERRWAQDAQGSL